MRGLAAGIVVALGMSGGTAGPARSEPAAELARELYGGRDLVFEIHRRGRKVGTYDVRFIEGDDALRVHSRFELSLDFLIFRYDFRYDSTEVWRDGRLTRLEATVDDDGDVHVTTLRRTAAGYRLNGPDGPDTVASSAPLFPTTHWNPGVIGQDRVFNTLTGRVNRVEIRDRGAETVETAGGPRPARRYEYTGDLETEVWYDAGGRWVKLRFEGRDGSVIDYKCVTCGANDEQEDLADGRG